MSDETKSDSLQSLQSGNHHLPSENQRIRDLVISLSATSPRTIALDPPRDRHDATIAERLLQEPEDCFCCAEYRGRKKETAEGFNSASYEFMAKVIEIETKLRRITGLAVSSGAR
jgi:CHASE2 domain-containing sensor protein